MSELKPRESFSRETSSERSPLGNPLHKSHSSRGLRIPTVDEEDLGLHVLYKPSGLDIVCNVIAVHGIGVDPRQTWVQKKTGTNWLSDENMLPKRIPNAAIMTFNYNSIWFGDKSVNESIDGVARKLLGAIDELQHEEKHVGRPIILLGHCFGGLVMESAYIHACQFPDDFPEISNIILGMVFLGTPHYGIRAGTVMSQGEVVANILERELEAQGISSKPKTGAIRSMVQEDHTLKAVVDRFTRILSTTNPAPLIFCFYEQIQANVGLIVGQSTDREIVVEETSGTLSGFKKEGLALDHFNMNKYSNPENAHFKAVSREIRKMVNKANEKALEKVPPISSEQNFAPRDGVLKRIHEKFSKSVEVVLCGPPGSGKTHVAVAYAHEIFHKENPQAPIFWVYANSAEMFELSYVRIAETLHIDKETLRKTGTTESVFQRLKQDFSGDWLMVVDGLENEDSLISTERQTSGRSLCEFIPHGRHANVITTTRSSSIASRRFEDGSGHIIKLKSLDSTDASVLLLGKTKLNPEEKKLVENVTKILGTSSGTLALSWSYIGVVGIDTFLERLKMQKDCLNQFDQIWQLMYGFLEGKDNDEHHVHNLALIVGAIEVQCIPRVFFSREELKEYIPRLVKYGIIEPSNGNREYSVGTQLRHCIQLWLKNDKEQREFIEGRLIRTTNDRFREGTETLLLPTALAVSNLKASSSKDREALEALLFKIGVHFVSLGKLDRGIEKLNECLISRQQLISASEEKKKLVDITLKELQNAQELKRSVPEVNAKEGQKAKHREKIQRSQIDNATQKLQDLESLDSDWQNRTTVYAANEAAGLRLQYSQGHSRKKDRKGGNNSTNAIEPTDIYRKIHSWYEKGNGATQEEKYKAKFNLACALDSKCQSKDAEALYRSSLDFYKTKLQKNADEESRVMYFRILNNLAALFAQGGKLDAAEDALQQVLQDQVDHLGVNHPDTLLTRHNMALLLQEQMQYDEADSELRKVLNAQANILGNNHQRTLQTMRSIANNTWMRGDRNRAKDMLRDIHATQTEVLGGDHHHTLETYDALKRILQKL